MASQHTRTSKADDDEDDAKEAKKASARSTRESDPAPGETAIAAGTWPTPIDGFRAAVAGVAVTVINPAAGDALNPYPTGTPLAAGSKFWLKKGFYKSATPT
jgi:hypothetical protein